MSNAFWRFIGVEVEDAREGWCRLRVPLRDELPNAPGAPAHGGLYSALVDMAVGGALSTMHEQAEGGVGQTTLDLNVSFLSAISEGDVIAEGRILRRGRSVAFGEAIITDSAGKLAAVGRDLHDRRREVVILGRDRSGHGRRRNGTPLAALSIWCWTTTRWRGPIQTFDNSLLVG